MITSISPDGIAVNGVSTRKVSQITEELCGTKFSKSTVSELCKNLDPIIVETSSTSHFQMSVSFYW